MKKSGPDNILLEVIKRCNLDDVIMEFGNCLLKEDVKPKRWLKLGKHPLPETGYLSNTESYKGISLLSIFAKYVSKIILNRLPTKMASYLLLKKTDFRPSKTTTSVILFLRRFVEGVKSHNQKKHLSVC